MRLNHTNLIPFALGRSWLDGDAAIAGDAVVIERRLRHTSFVVEQRQGGGVFLKQLHDSHPGAAASLRREVALYRAITAGKLPALKAFVPAFIDYDEHEKILALARFDGISAQDRAVAGQPINPLEAAAVGTALGAAHGISSSLARAAAPGALDEALPWAFHLPHHLTNNPASVPGSGLAFLELLKAHLGLVDWLGQMAIWWRRTTLIHGDLKWENIMLTGGSQGPAADSKPDSDLPEVRLIDWELAAAGDPAWDAATVLQATLLRTCLVRSSPDPLSRADLEPHHGAMHAFLQRWLNGYRPADLNHEYQLLLGYTATRLAFSAYEHATVSPQIHPAIRAMVATAWQMLGNPRHGARLLGFES